MAYHAIRSLPPKGDKRLKTLRDVPLELITEWSYKLFALMNLAWDYIDTICDLCATHKLQSTKKIIRQIHEIKCEYDRFRQRNVSNLDEMEKFEIGHGLRLEEYCETDFAKLFYCLDSETKRQNLNPVYSSLAVAIQQALTLMDAVKLYARWCDERIASFDVWTCDCCMVQTEFLQLYPLVPQLARNIFTPDPGQRKLTA